jgi:hypothetical protein
MGLDFIRKTKPTFKKAWRNGLDHLSKPGLFTPNPAFSRAILATLSTPGLAEGDLLLLRLKGTHLSVVRSTAEVGTIENLPPEVLEFLQSNYGVACGIVAQLHPLSGTADIRI